MDARVKTAMHVLLGPTCPSWSHRQAVGRVKWGAKAASNGRASSGSMMVPSLVGGHEVSFQLPMLPAGTALRIGISRAEQPLGLGLDLQGDRLAGHGEPPLGRSSR